MAEQLANFPKKKPHSVLSKIAGEIKTEDNDAFLPSERFEHWVMVLWRKYPRAKNKLLYGQLVGLSFELVQYKSLAALQLFTLGTLGLSAPDAARLGQSHGILDSAKAKKLRARAEQLVSPGAGGALSSPTSGMGVGLRPNKQKKRK